MDTISSKTPPTINDLVLELERSLERFPINTIWLDRIDDSHYHIYVVSEGVIMSSGCYLMCVRYTIKSTVSGYEYTRQQKIQLPINSDLVKLDAAALDAAEWCISSVFAKKLEELLEMSCLLESKTVLSMDDVCESLETISTSPVHYYYEPTKNVIRVVRVDPSDYVGTGTPIIESHLTCDYDRLTTDVICLGSIPQSKTLDSLKFVDLHYITRYQYEQLSGMISSDPLQSKEFIIRLNEIWTNRGQ